MDNGNGYYLLVGTVFHELEDAIYSCNCYSYCTHSFPPDFFYDHSVGLFSLLSYNQNVATKSSPRIRCYCCRHQGRCRYTLTNLMLPATCRYQIQINQQIIIC